MIKFISKSQNLRPKITKNLWTYSNHQKSISISQKSNSEKDQSINLDEKFKSINLKTIRTITTGSTCLNTTTETNQTIQTDTDQSSLTDQSNLMKDVNNAEDLTILLEIIKPHLNQLKFKQIDDIFSKIMQLGIRTEKLSLEPKFDPEFSDQLISSPIHRTLLNQAANFIKTNSKVSIEFQIKLLKILSLINLNPDGDEVKLVLRGLNMRIGSLTLLQLIEFLQILMTYQSKPGYSGLFTNLSNNLLRTAENKFLNNKFVSDDYDTMIECMNIFLVKRCHDAIAYSTELLLSSSTKLNYEQAIDLLKTLKKVIAKKSNKFDQMLESNLAKLIDKCNSKIIEEITQHPTEHNALIYVRKITPFIDGYEFNLKNYYNPKILELLTPILITNQAPLIGLFIYKLIYNYSRFLVFDERLLKHMYELAFTDDQFRSEFGIGTFFLFFRFKFPFVDHQKLAKLILHENSNEITKLINLNYAPVLRLICELILCDVFDQKMIDHLDSISSRELCQKVLVRDFKFINIAKKYISMRSNQTELEREIESKFMSLCDRILLDAPLAQTKRTFFKIDNRITENCYLDGVYLNSIAVYDNSAGDLVSLTDYQNYFDKLHKIQLKENHELLAFIHCKKLEGNIEQCELMVNLVLKKILHNYKIKPVEIDFTGFGYSPEDKVTYLVKMAQNYFVK